jgi:hypothetical protein
MPGEKPPSGTDRLKLPECYWLSTYLRIFDMDGCCWALIAIGVGMMAFGDGKEFIYPALVARFSN